MGEHLTKTSALHPNESQTDMFHPNDTVDLLIPGGGLAGASLIQELTLSVPSSRLNRQFRILAVEKSGDFGGGLAYGKGVPIEFLLNDQVRITGCRDFENWLVSNQSTWLTKLKEHRSQATEQWLRVHDRAISSCDLSDLHIPRRVFGDFVRDELNQACQRARRLGCNVELRHDEVAEIEREPGDRFAVRLKRSGVVHASLITLAVGAAPRSRSTVFRDTDGYIDNFYSQDLSDLTLRLKGLLSKQRESERRILIKGGNTTAAEFIYFLSFTPLLAELNCKLIVVTPRGELLPAAQGTDLPPFASPRLEELSRMIKPTADDLWLALESDYKYGNDHGYTVLDNVDHTQPAFLAALNALQADEQLRWVIKYGDRQQNLVRRIPTEYYAAAQQLHCRGLLRVERGKVTDITRNGGSLFSVQIATDNGHREVATAVIIDCSGFGSISTTTDPLLSQLRDSTSLSLSANETDKGFKLRSSFEASENLFVLGPLMTGFSGPGTHIWHLQNIRRIRELAGRVAPLIWERLSLLRPHVSTGVKEGVR